MKLSKALKLKNKKAKLVQTLGMRFQSNNSYREDTPPTYDSKKAYEEYLEAKKDLVALKVAIQKTNQPIMDKILYMAEIKEVIATLSRVSAVEGPQEVYGSEKTIIWKSTYGRIELDQMQESLENELEALQDAIEEFNATTELEGYA